MAREERVMTRMNDMERLMLKELAQQEDRSEGQMIRMLIRQEYEKRVGGERVGSIKAENSTVAE
jgi:hypothetical protein